MMRLLLVEDNASNRKLIGGVLRRAGHEISIVETAAAGIDLAMQERFDLVLMDIQLPGMDGLTGAKILRNNETTASVPILAVTAHAMHGDEERILEAGCDGYVAKPISYRQLLAEVDRLLTENRAEG